MKAIDYHAYCRLCNEQAEVELSWSVGPPVVLIGQHPPARDVYGQLDCPGCRWPYITEHRGCDVGYELIWMRHALWYGL